MDVLIPVIIFIVLGAVCGALLAFASQKFAVKKDEKAEAVAAALPGANCGGCGRTGCNALAAEIAAGKASPAECTVANDDALVKIGEIMGKEYKSAVRMRAQVMCSGTAEYSKKKYIYEGTPDCVAASMLDGGNKLCPNGCIGLGTCAKKCPFGAIAVRDGVAVVDYVKCTGCGVCIDACPKNIIRLIPYDAYHWVGCMSVDDGKMTKEYCDVGCISCHICEKNCPAGAISVTNYTAAIDYAKCTDCGACVDKCPRHIIWSGKKQGEYGLVIKRI